MEQTNKTGIIFEIIGPSGVERNKENGATVSFDAEGDWTVDSIVYAATRMLKSQLAERGYTLQTAIMVHDIGGDNETEGLRVSDNLLTGIRSGSFIAPVQLPEELTPNTEVPPTVTPVGEPRSISGPVEPTPPENISVGEDAVNETVIVDDQPTENVEEGKL